MSVPWVPDPHRRGLKTAKKLVHHQTKAHNILTISPLNARKDTVVIPRSDQVPDPVYIPPTKPAANPKPVVNRHQDDVNSSVIVSRRELYVNPDKVASMAALLEDQLLQTRWL